MAEQKEEMKLQVAQAMSPAAKHGGLHVVEDPEAVKQGVALQKTGSESKNFEAKKLDHLRLWEPNQTEPVIQGVELEEIELLAADLAGLQGMKAARVDLNLA